MEDITRDKEELSVLFAKMHLMDSTEGENLLVEHLAGITGGFHTKLIAAFWAADHWNKIRLVDAFPELSAIHKYTTIPEYWGEFKKKFGLEK